MSKKTTGQNSEMQTGTKTPAVLQDDALEAVTGGAKKISGSVGKGGKNSIGLVLSLPSDFQAPD